jgi:hypothetical protein
LRTDVDLMVPTRETPQSYCVITDLSPHPEELARASVSKDEARKYGNVASMVRDGARAPPHHEGLMTQ